MWGLWFHSVFIIELSTYKAILRVLGDQDPVLNFDKARGWKRRQQKTGKEYALTGQAQGDNDTKELQKVCPPSLMLPWHKLVYTSHLFRRREGEEEGVTLFPIRKWKQDSFLFLFLLSLPHLHWRQTPCFALYILKQSGPRQGSQGSRSSASPGFLVSAHYAAHFQNREWQN